MDMLVANKIVQGLWIGSDLSIMQEICINSYLHHDHEFHLYVYTPVKNVPNRTIIKDANCIIPIENIFKDGFGSYATFSDWFRIELLYKCGGWWVDMDTICMQPLDFEEEYIFATELDGERESIINAQMKCPMKSNMLKECREIIRQKNLTEVGWTEIGGLLLKEAVAKYDLWNYVADPNVFNPIPYNHFSLFFTNVLIEFSIETHTVHLWNEMLRKNNLNGNDTFHSQSFFERMKQRYIG